MNHREEQDSEVEVLDSIYCQDFEKLGSDPYRFTITIQSESYEPSSGNGLRCKLKFELPKMYPEEPPKVSITDVENFREVDKVNLMSHLEKEAEDHLGEVMIFSIVSSGQEWLNMRWDEVQQEREDAAKIKAKEEEEAEKKKFEGTPVTVESFLNWKVKFDEDMREKRKGQRIEKDGKKLTGRELFMQDKTLNESDLQFLDDDSSDVKVDESLFTDFSVVLNMSDEDDDDMN